MAQRVLDFKKKAWLTVVNMDSNLLNSCSVHHPLSIEQVGEPPSNLSKRWGRVGGLDRISTFRGDLLGKRG